MALVQISDCTHSICVHIVNIEATCIGSVPCHIVPPSLHWLFIKYLWQGLVHCPVTCNFMYSRMHTWWVILASRCLVVVCLAALATKGKVPDANSGHRVPYAHVWGAP
jgi:hypothetical protein